jgi:S1/P1 Nuclease
LTPSISRDDNRSSKGKHQSGTQESITHRRRWFIITLTLLVAGQTATPVWAWGRLGHRVISRLAEKQLTPKAKAAITELLEPGESLADTSLWADQNRGRLPKTAPWRYVDVPLDEPRYDAKFSGDISTKGIQTPTNSGIQTPTSSQKGGKEAERKRGGKDRQCAERGGSGRPQ